MDGRREQLARVTLGLVAPCVAVVALGVVAEGPVDDAYISFRYAWNLVQGHGLVYNPGEAVEGYSNPLWTLLVALGLWLGAAPLALTRGLSIAAHLAIVAACYVASRRARPALPVPLAPWLAALSSGLLLSVGSGLETVLFTALLLWGWLAQAHEEERSATPIASIACLVLATWTRPEGVAWALVLVLARAGRPGRRAWLRAASVVAAAVGWLVVRQVLYDAWVPTSAVARVGDVSTMLERGVRYVGPWLSRVMALAALGVGALFLPRAGDATRGREVVALVSGIVAAALLVGGDWMLHARYLVPAEPFLGLWAEAWGPVVLSLGPRLGRPLAAALVVLLVQARGLEVVQQRAAARDNHDGWDSHAGAIARWLERRHVTGTVAVADIGEVGWVLRGQMQVLDLFGLVSPAIARMPGAHMLREGQAYADYVYGAAPGWLVLKQGDGCVGGRTPAMKTLSGDPRLAAQYRLAWAAEDERRRPWCLYQRVP